MHTYVIALDQGTTSSRAVLFDESAQIVAMKSYEFEQIYPQPGWVEHDPAAILNTQVDALREVVRISGVPLDSNRHHQPARDHAALGSENRQAAAQRDCLAMPQNRADCRPTLRGRT